MVTPLLGRQVQQDLEIGTGCPVACSEESKSSCSSVIEGVLLYCGRVGSYLHISKDWSNYPESTKLSYRQFLGG